MSITYIKGNVLEPVGEGTKVIAHLCNNLGLWGTGFSGQLSKKWKDPELSYRQFCKGLKAIHQSLLGKVDICRIPSTNIVIANMIAQKGINNSENRNDLVSYQSLISCLCKLDKFLSENKYSFHMPKIGNGLAGGDWVWISNIIKDYITVPTFIYEL